MKQSPDLRMISMRMSKQMPSLLLLPFQNQDVEVKALTNDATQMLGRSKYTYSNLYLRNFHKTWIFRSNSMEILDEGLLNQGFKVGSENLQNNFLMESIRQRPRICKPWESQNHHVEPEEPSVRGRRKLLYQPLKSSSSLATPTTPQKSALLSNQPKK